MQERKDLVGAYVTTFEPEDIHAWSGLIYHIKLAFHKGGIATESISNLEKRGFAKCAAKKVFYEKLLRKDYHRDRDPAVVEGYSEQIQSQIREQHDFVFSPGTLAIGKLVTDKPIVIWTDATFANLVECYPEYQNLCSETLANGHALEKEILGRLTLAVYSSEWAAKSAIEDYGIAPEKVTVIPFGANLVSERTEESIREATERKAKDVCRLLFVGVDWERKGGPTALRVAEELNARGVKTELHVVGVSPPGPVPEFVVAHGYLSKKDPAQLAAMNELFETSHFFMLPSKAECFGIVFSEAASFGLPALATKVGGIPTAVKEGENGYLFEPESSIEDYCDKVEALFARPEDYLDLSLKAFRRYQNELNWDAAGLSLRNEIERRL